MIELEVKDGGDWVAEESYQRVGTFEVAREFISLQSEVCQMLFSQVIVIGIEQNIRTDTFTYTALASHFDVIPKGGVVPRYAPWIHDHGVGSLPRFTVSWKTT